MFPCHQKNLAERNCYHQIQHHPYWSKYPGGRRPCWSNKLGVPIICVHGYIISKKGIFGNDALRVSSVCTMFCEWMRRCQLRSSIVKRLIRQSWQYQTVTKNPARTSGIFQILSSPLQNYFSSTSASTVPVSSFLLLSFTFTPSSVPPSAPDFD